MSGTPTVSVIVPIYNGAEYIGGCVDFLKAQTFRDFETLLCVDVGSTDGSLEKAEEAASGFPGCRVVEQTDGMHLAGARNAGLRNASGRFIWFCDVDDAPAPDLLEECVRIQRERGSCMVCFNAVNVGPRGTVKKSRRTYDVIDMDRAEAMESWVPMRIPVTAWSKFISRETAVGNGLFFMDSMAEDVVYTYELLRYCGRISVYLRPLYAYRQTYGSITRSEENMDRRGRDEIAAYSGVDAADMSPDVREKVLRNSAVFAMRSSGHMGRKAFLAFAKGPEFAEIYGKHLKGTFEGWVFRHFPRSYYVALRFYLRFLYKRDGSTYMRTKIRRRFFR